MGTRITASGATLDGLDLSGLDSDGVDWKVSAVTGWTGTPATTLDVEQKAADDGGWSTPNPNFGPRAITVAGSISGDPRLVGLAADKLNDAAGSGQFVKLTVDTAAGQRWAQVQQSDEVLIDDSLANSYTYSLQFTAADAFIYGDPLTGSTGLPATSGGLGVPFGVPFGIDSVVQSGIVSLVNPGNASGPVLIRVNGPTSGVLSGPIVTHRGTGLALVFATTLTLGPGEWLDIDMKNRRALANGTASRAGLISRRGWSLFERGGNTWGFTAASAAPGASIDVTATPAWK